MQKDQKFLTVGELAEVLDVPKSWIYERTRHNAIPHFKMGKYVRFDIDEVRQWLATNTHRDPAQNENRWPLTQETPIGITKQAEGI